MAAATGLVTAQAPAPGGGPVTIAGPVRVIDGDTLEVRIDGRRVGVGLIGIEAPQGNTPCGKEAAATLARLVAGGLTLVDDPEQAFDERTRRLYYATAPDGGSLPVALALAGVVRGNGRGAEGQAIAAAAREARARGVGCVVTP
jgi:micrococcal nuclease